MNLSSKPPTLPSLGLYLTFAYGSDEKYTVNFVESSTVHTVVHIELPDRDSSGLIRGVSGIISTLQMFRKWPIRLEYDNAMQFFDMEKLAMLEQFHPDCSFYLYGVPSFLLNQPSSSVTKIAEKAYYKKKAERRKLARVGGSV